MTSNTPRKRKKATTSTLRELYLYSGNECAFYDCTERLLDSDGAWIAEIAHIYGVEESGPRGEHCLDNDELRAASNLMLLCPNHHDRIDKDLNTYTVEYLQAMKQQHEDKYRKGINEIEHMIDLTTQQEIKYPVNFDAISDFKTLEENELAEKLEESKSFFDAIANLGPGLRDLIYIILSRGSLCADGDWASSKTDHVVRVLCSDINSHSNLRADDLKRRVEVLKDKGLLKVVEIEEDGSSVEYFTLCDPTGAHRGFDLFAELHRLGDKNGNIIKRAIMELDFTVFSEVN